MPNRRKKQIEQVIGRVQDGAAELAEQAAGTVRELGGTADAERLADAVNEAAHKLRQVDPAEIVAAGEQRLRQVADQADDATRALGARLEDAADELRNYSPADGRAAHVSRQVAARLERGGGYLREQGAEGTLSRLIAWARRNPLQATLAGVGVLALIRRLGRGR